jgi:DNA polymerase-1
VWDLRKRVNVSEVFLAVLSQAVRFAEGKPLDPGDGSYRIITSREEAIAWIQVRQGTRTIALDIEGDGDPDTVHPSRHDILCLGLCDGHETVILPEELFDGVLWPELADALEACDTVAHNGKFDAGVLGFRLRGINRPLRITHDTMLAHYALWPAGGEDGEHADATSVSRAYHGLKLLGDLYLACGNWSLALTEYKNMRSVPLERLYRYNAWDVQRTYLLLQIFRDQFRHHPEQLKAYWNVLMPASPHLGWMEGRGLTVDVPYVRAELVPDMTGQVADLTRTLIGHADKILPGQEWPLVAKAKRLPDEDVKQARRFNPGSADQVRTILESQGVVLPVDRKAKTNKGSTAKRTLEILLRKRRKGDPFLTDLLERRRVEKLLGTYVLPLSRRPHTDHPFEGTRIFPSYHMHKTLTGRLASSGPNIQNQPKYKPLRRCYVARGPGRIVMQSDYGQAELRVMAVLGRDDFLMRFFRSEHEFNKHLEPGQKKMDLFNALMPSVFADVDFKAHPEAFDEKRRQLKTVVYGLSFGRGARDISEDINCTPMYAQGIIDDYLASVPGITAWRQDVLDHVRYDVPLVSRFGRYLLYEPLDDKNQPDIERRALSFLPQSSASDCCLMAAIDLGKYIQENELDWEMSAIIHDAIILDIPEEDREKAQMITEEFMVNSAARHFPEVPFSVDTQAGLSWADL